jgi:hypothetical protein
MRRRNRYPALFFLRRLVNLIKRHVTRPTLGSHVLGDRRRQRRLAMINMSDRPTLTCGLVLSNFSFAISSSPAFLILINPKMQFKASPLLCHQGIIANF